MRFLVCILDTSNLMKKRVKIFVQTLIGKELSKHQKELSKTHILLIKPDNLVYILDHNLALSYSIHERKTFYS